MRRPRYTPSWHSKRKSSWLRNTLLLILIGLPLLLILAELIARGAVLATGSTNQLAPNKSIAIAQSYAFKLQDVNGNSYPGLPDEGRLQVRRSPLLGYELLPSQSSDYWQINDQGFRQDSSVPIDKSANEIRVFIVGNSTAFTNMAEKNQKALAFKIEKLLNDRVRAQNANPEKFKPKEIPYFADQVEAMKALPPRIRDGSYRVIAAAVPGYSSGNELALVAHRVTAYSPNALIILDGYEDLRLSSNQPAHEIGNVEQMLRDPIAQYRQHQTQQFNNWLNSLYLVKAWQKWVVPADITTFSSDYQIFNAEQFSKDPKELQKRIDRYIYNTKQMTKLVADIPSLIVLQPEITGKQKSLTKEEEGIVKSLGKEYSDRLANSYKVIDSALNKNFPNTKFLNFYQLFQDANQQAFVDPIHLTEAANDIMAQKLYENVERLFSVQPAPNSPQTGDVPPPAPAAPPAPVPSVTAPEKPPENTQPPASLSETLQRVQGQ
ncbi:SGNH/GDSL hydrolase family protein [Pseudanabaena sp. FACHB-1998]|uniref:SGNH/GDSL hydrolase family protein n=1 Tax=Pseudanabaena sp. FACHB-1998 TaxID=2692858 RepID=UPI0016808975|nr:SGNH/GDSL hydrolase family protein [Pseudanabaena sp. FACHB-1998]MBD2177832.1 SGNH/GDSL hydrolase family protein [Pseudanabaena sp. FACHB-1998]